MTVEDIKLLLNPNPNFLCSKIELLIEIVLGEIHRKAIAGSFTQPTNKK